MADWYVSSVAYAAVPQWAATHAYSVGDFVRALATPTFAYSHFVHRCTTAGTSAGTEPSWSQNNNATTTSGTATFTNVTSQSTYGWSAAAANLYVLGNGGFPRAVGGDRIFLSSDHSEAVPTPNHSFGSAGFTLVQIISVNRAGSVPPVAADILSGAVISTSVGALTLDALTNVYWQGVTFTMSQASPIYLNSSGVKAQYFKNCAFVITSTSTSSTIRTNDPGKFIWDNVTVQFGHIGQQILSAGYSFDLVWLNTLSAIQGAIVPTTLFFAASQAAFLVTCRGVDLSAIVGTLGASTASSAGIKLLLDSCRINSGLTRYGTPGTSGPSGDEIELVNCFDGTNVVNERHTPAGDITADRATMLTGGAADDIGAYSLKLANGARSDKFTMPLDNFWFDLENVAIGVLKTATVEIASPASLNTDDVQFMLEYMNTALTMSTTATWSTTDKQNITLSNGNLTAVSSSFPTGVRASSGASSGKFYFEMTVSTWADASSAIGMVTGTQNYYSSGLGGANSVGVNKGGSITNNTASSYSLGSRSAGDVIGIAVDLTAKLLWFKVAPSGNWNGNSTANPATGVNGIDISAWATVAIFPAFNPWATTGDAVTANFGASGFSGAVPSGFAPGWGTTGTYPIASFGNSLPSPLATPAALSASTAIWTAPAFSVWNPGDVNGMAVSSNGLTMTSNAVLTPSQGRGLHGYSSGKYYFEIRVDWIDGTSALGMGSATATGGPVAGVVGTVGFAKSGGIICVNGSSVGLTLGARASGDIIGYAIDFGANLIWFRVAPAGNWNGSGAANPATGVGGANFTAAGSPLFPYFSAWANTTDSATANFGASAFSGTVPSGFTSGWPNTLVKQQVQTLFTPQVAGRVRGLVRLGKPKTVAWVNPQIGITPGPTIWNAIDNFNSRFVVSNAGLTVTSNNFAAGIRTVKGFSTGKFYFEVTMTTWGLSDSVGVAVSTAAMTSNPGAGQAVVVKSIGQVWVNNSGVGGSLGGRANGDVICVAVDIGANLLWLRVAPSGNWNGSGTADPATGIGGNNISAIAGTLMPFVGANQVGTVATANFGPSTFSGTVPSGFTAGWPSV